MPITISKDPTDRILRLPEVEKIVNLKRTAIYRAIKSGTFPAPVRLSVRAVGWKLSDIKSWLNNLKTSQEQ